MMWLLECNVFNANDLCIKYGVEKRVLRRKDAKKDKDQLLHKQKKNNGKKKKNKIYIFNFPYMKHNNILTLSRWLLQCSFIGKRVCTENKITRKIRAQEKGFLQHVTIK